MGKSNRATRKELEGVIGKLIQEVQLLRHYVGAYVRYKGDTLQFNDFLKKEFEKIEKNQQKLEQPKKSEQVDKKERYKKVTTPPL